MVLPAALDSDPEIREVLARELERQRRTIQLIASENFTSRAVMAATASELTNKYSEGYPHRRYYGGNTYADEAEEMARQRAKSLFGADHANVQPHAGAPANLAAYLALVEPGDTILAMRLDQGGHLTHGSPVSLTGKIYRFVSYGVTPAGSDGTGERIDLDQVRDLALRERPQAHRGRHHGVCPHHRSAAFPSDCRRGERPLHVRRCAPRRAHRRRRAPEPGRHRRRGDLHHPQDAAGAAWWRRSVRRRPSEGDRRRRLPRPSRRSARPCHRRQGRCLRRSGAAGVLGRTRSVSSRTRRRSPIRCRGGLSARLPAAQRTIRSSWTCVLSTPS